MFSVYSEHAEMLELCLFNDLDQETQRFSFTAADNGVWHGYLPGAMPGQRYGFRAHGEFQPERGHYFNPQRLLLDPYARAMSGRYEYSPVNAVCRFDETSADATTPLPALSFGEDNAGYVPRSVVLGAQAGVPGRLFRKPSRRVIYEAHVAGLTALHAALPAELRGRFAGAGSPEIIGHLRALGVTSLELLPVQAFIDEPHLSVGGLSNYWGYNSLNFFVPHGGYATDQGAAHEEMKSLIRALHDANIEVLLDVVYNHTAEGGPDGPTLCYRGLDNATYYKLDAANAHAYVNDTGCGNTLDTNNSVVQQLVLDSLRYWVQEFGVDGFRFDLAVSLGREPNGFNAGHRLFQAFQTDPVLANCSFIAEPWDVGPGGYQTGGFRAPWLEWNDRFRDAARSYWRNDAGAQAELGKRMHGSSDLFEASGRNTLASVNFITAHDGFTLADVVAYECKHNEANLEENRDGHSNNLSANLGVEGVTADPLILAARDRRARALLATLVFAQGTPMFLAGDELKNSQGGNNNAYCQNNPTGWLQWNNAQGTHINLLSRLIDVRNQLDVFGHMSHVHAEWRGDPVPDTGVQVSWRCFDGLPMQEEHWQESACEGAMPFALLWATRQELVLLALNPSPLELALTLPIGFEWQCVVDTSALSGVPSTIHSHAASTHCSRVSSQSFCVFYAADSRGLVKESST